MIKNNCAKARTICGHVYKVLGVFCDVWIWKKCIWQIEVLYTKNVDSETCNSINLSKALLWEIMWKYYCLPQKTFWCKKLANLQCIPCFIAFLHLLTGLGVSELRDDPNYIRFYMNWTRFITTALIPITGKYHLNNICQIRFYMI